MLVNLYMKEFLESKSTKNVKFVMHSRNFQMKTNNSSI